MDKLFGLQMETLLVGLGALLAAGLLLLVVLALRNRVLFWIGVRNIGRRPVQTVLIVLGLMLATLLVSAALVTGDTMKHSIQTSALTGLGDIDLIIEAKQAEGAGLGAAPAAGAVDSRLGKAELKRAQKALKGADIDGLAAVVRETVPAASAKGRRNLPGLTVLGVDPDYEESFAPPTTASGRRLKIAALEEGEAYLSVEAAEKLAAKTRDTIQVYVNNRPTDVVVAGLFASGAKPSQGSVMVTSLSDAQDLLGWDEGFSMILVSGTGDAIAGAVQTKDISKRLKPVVTGKPFDVSPVKQDALEAAAEAASAFTGIFLVFGQFSMMAGIMLIFLIFVMLAAERKVELGVMRALGAQKRDLLKIFLFEGAVYAALSALVGALAGIAVGWAMVRVMAEAFGQVDFSLSFSFEFRSIVIAYAIGVIATFLIVFISAWRAGRINIVRAIRDLPEPLKAGRSWKLFVVLIFALVGSVAMLLSGYESEQRGTFTLGLSLIIIIVPLLARWLRLPDRAAFTMAGLGLLIVWLMPESMFVAVVPGYEEFEGGLELFFISGMAIVTGAVWTVMYNSDILLSLVTLVFGRIKGLPPILRIAVNYPMSSRVRTGLTLAMFSLVVFTMVFMSGLLGSFNSVFDNVEGLTGGYDIRGTTGGANPVKSIDKTLAKSGNQLDPGDFAAIGTLAGAPVDVRQQGVKKQAWTGVLLRGADEGYAQSINYTFRLRSAEYKTDRAVWQALIDEEDVVVVPSNLVPAKVSFNAGEVTPDFQLSGFFREDAAVPEDIYIETKNALTQETMKLRVIGVIDDLAIYAFGGGITSQKTLESVIGVPVPATSFWFKVNQGVKAERTADALATLFYQNGMETTVLAEEIADSTRANKMINRLLQAFMGLGLMVGIAALGVIAARSVVERRRHIGMLRAIGFRRTTVQAAFIVESSFIALLGIFIGSVLGLILSYNVAGFMSRDMPGLVFQWPWAEVAAIAGLAYAASLLTTFIPARQAAKVYPAEALRYE